MCRVFRNTLVDTGLETLPHRILSYDPSSIDTPIKSQESNQQGQEIYAISGQHVGTATYHNGQLCTEGLKPGLYIIGGKKVVVK